LNESQVNPGVLHFAYLVSHENSAFPVFLPSVIGFPNRLGGA
jgi:hypothetical protein